ncbi:Zn-dependent hydrolase [Paenibacillus sp. BSR1-1]|uniref:Zn-dependent hydrolase n=1 Tax=Paenibacillus sp. BSR1-1 TaxID=3020845 RepID=UPI0025AFFD77|nr:Zn-dependent hydrolase [Paenibacillus sp. BSR1-1]MDN3015831.1 Zn-dependent hydrolase [Paenibacillus sp. BSR1-1]
MKINLSRLQKDIERYATYGKNEHGGVTRPSFSHEDHQVRRLFIEELTELGLQVTIDGAANIWGKYEGTSKKKGSIVIGSHLDSVPNGGKYDGPLGVLTAKEIITTLKEHQIKLNHDLEIVSFTAEESNDFNLSTFGSRAFVGKLKPQNLRETRDSKGALLQEELMKVGGGLDQFSNLESMQKEKKAFIEIHIEQGQRLENANISMAIIDRVVGTFRSFVTVIGEANHSGTTMMNNRKDALTAAAEMILEVERYCRIKGNMVGTVGKLTVTPNAANIIPGQIDFILEVRAETEEAIQNGVNAINQVWQKIAEKREVVIQQEVFLDQKPVVLDEDLVAILENTASEMNEPYLRLPSMAVHDAAHMASVTKSVMVFVKSIGGKSHCPEEYSEPYDIQKAANLVLQGIVQLDRKMSETELSV